jgi:hypothetical protein
MIYDDIALGQGGTAINPQTGIVTTATPTGTTSTGGTYSSPGYTTNIGASTQTFAPSTTALSPTASANEAVSALTGDQSAQLKGSISGVPTLDSLMLDAKKYRDQILGLTSPDTQELQARKDLNQANNTLRNFDVSVEGGLQQIMKKPIALEFQQGQEAALTRDAAFTRSSLTRSVDVANQTLQTLQNARLELLQKLNTAYGFGQDDIATRFKLDEIQREEQKAARQFALEAGVTGQFYNIGGTVYRTSDGKAYSTPEQFFADGGARDFSNVQVIDPTNLKTEALVYDLMTKYPDAGILPNDSYETAAAKVSSSKLYQDSLYHPSSGGGGGGSSKAELKSEAENGIYTYLSQNAGSDGYVSPEAWYQALAAWVQDGYPYSDFFTNFKRYINPADPQDYQ